MNSSYRLQPEGLIITELSYDPELIWYGLYHNMNSDLFEFEIVDIEIVSFKSSIGGLCAELSIENPNRRGNPGFFIGSSKKLNQGVKSISRTNLFECQVDTINCNFNIGGNKYSFRLDSNSGIERSLKMTKGQVEQLLVSGISKSTFVRLRFVDDLDGDDNLDLILNVYKNTGDGSQEGTYSLLLSSEAHDNNLVELVSKYNWSTGGCD